MKILVLNYYPLVVPPTSGGEARLYNLYYNMAKDNPDLQITFLGPYYGPAQEARVAKILPNFESRWVPKGEAHHHFLPLVLKDLELGVDPHGINSIVCSRLASNLGRECMKVYEDHDLIIHEHPYENYSDPLAGHDNKPRIYSSHNVESEMFCAFSNNICFHAIIEECELDLVKKADKVFAVSEKDKEHFSKYNEEVAVIPNGFDEHQTRKTLDLKISSPYSGKRVLLFIGSSHKPNVDAANYIINTLSPTMPDSDFVICGSCCGHIDAIPGENVYIKGFVSDALKNELMHTATAFINPISSGGGSNLKIIEAMASGTRVVSTHFGARGYDITEKGILYTCDLRDMAETIEFACGDRAYPDNFKNWSEEIYEKYSWRNISKKFAAEAKGLL